MQFRCLPAVLRQERAIVMTKCRDTRFSRLFCLAVLLTCQCFAVLWACVTPAFAQYIYVANTGEATLSEIDINTNKEVARFRTWFNMSPFGPAPSRIAVGTGGEIYVLNRMFDFPNPTNTAQTKRLPLLFKILPPLPGPGTSHVTGSGLVGTLPPGEVLDLLDNAPANGKIDAVEIQDIRVLNSNGWPRGIGIAPADEGGLGRALCFDLDGNLWVGLYLTQQYYKVSPVDGSLLAGPIATPNPHRPYGCVVDSQGRLWSASSGTTLAEITDTRNPTSPAIIHDHSVNGSNYGISLRRGCGGEETRVYLSSLSSRTYIEYNPATGQFTNTSTPVASLVSYAVAVDSKGDIVSGYRDGRVVKYDPSGTSVWDTNVLPAGPTKASGDLHGLIIDANDDVWAVLRNENQVVKYSGLDGHQIAVVDVGKEPYTYGNVQTPSCPVSPDIDISLVTGWDEDARARLPRGTADDDWTVAVGAGAARPAVLVAQPPAAWPRFRPSEWLSANTSGASQAGAATMRFERCFCLAADATNAKLTMRLWADDQATVLLNGVTIAGPAGQFRRAQPLSVLHMGTVGSSLFQTGNNCVAVVVDDIRQLFVGLDVAGSVWVDQGKCDGVSY